METWVRLHDFNRYSVSDMGRVRNDVTGRIMGVRRNKHGVYYVGLIHEDSGIQKTRSLASLVATEFVPNPQNFTTPIHLDGQRGNNQADNLLWRPFWFATVYQAQFLHPHLDLSTPVINKDTKEWQPNIWTACITHGLLEKDLHLAIMNRTFVYPTYQYWEFEE